VELGTNKKRQAHVGFSRPSNSDVKSTSLWHNEALVQPLPEMVNNSVRHTISCSLLVLLFVCICAVHSNLFLSCVDYENGGRLVSETALV
jgi:hypothetical protein